MVQGGAESPTSRICRSCASDNLSPVLDLGCTPLADRLLTAAQLEEPEPHFPLEVAFCNDCGLVQILETVPPEILFCDKYPYYSSFSDALLRHSRENVLDLMASRSLNRNSLVVELASNDGYLLQNYVEAGIPVLGIDPADGPAAAAERVGVPTLNTFFSVELAAELAATGQRADVIHANNVLAHVADTNGFVRGIGTLLKDDGVAVIEVPYVRDLIDHCEFDTIYHEHLCYFSLTALDRLFRRHGLFVNDVRRLAIHGGSLRLYVGKQDQVQSAVKSLLAAERAAGLDTPEFYREFSARVSQVRDALRGLVAMVKSKGMSVAAYGAAAKGSTLINYVGLGGESIGFVVDRNVHKQGRFMPGKRIPILRPEALLEEMPDFVLILSWNFADEIMEQQNEYRSRGGKFIIPIPEPMIV